MELTSKEIKDALKSILYLQERAANRATDLLCLNKTNWYTTFESVLWEDAEIHATFRDPHDYEARTYTLSMEEFLLTDTEWKDYITAQREAISKAEIEAKTRKKQEENAKDRRELNRLKKKLGEKYEN
jgi:hypothetical protein